MFFQKSALILLVALHFSSVRGQYVYNVIPNNTITTAVQSVAFITNAQSMGSGMVGVVAPDLYTQNGLDQNPAMLSRGTKVMGFQFLNYVPWLRVLVPDLNVYELGYYQSIDSNNAIGFAARYFDLGEVMWTNNQGNFIGVIHPKEFMVSLKYAHSFSNHFSMGTGIKYIYSDLTEGMIIDNYETKPGQSVACDLGFDYRTALVKKDSFQLRLNAGLSILSIGSKVSYTYTGAEDFIPQEMKAGVMFTFQWNLRNNNQIAVDLAYQASKFLVPTPPIYATDSLGNVIPDGEGGFVLTDGMDPNVSPIKGAIQSFYDAPGGMEEELHEIMHQAGFETRCILLDHKLLAAFRAGYFHEHETKGNRKFFTLGGGFGYGGFRIDLAYWLPTNQRSPLENTLSISLGARFNLGGKQFFRFSEIG